MSPSTTVTLVLLCVASVLGATSQHSAKDIHKTQAGWQEPGLWRPKWVMERFFTPPTSTTAKKAKRATDADDLDATKVVKRDRLFLRLKNDRTVKLYTQSSRPLVEWRKKRVFRRASRKLFEAEEDSNAKADESVSMSDEGEERDKGESEGTWWWKDLSPVKQGHVKIELRGEGDDFLVHETFCDWGKLDPYVAKFKRGKILKYKRSEAGVVPSSMEEVGHFYMKVSVHRPLVSKEFLAFQ